MENQLEFEKKYLDSVESVITNIIEYNNKQKQDTERHIKKCLDDAFNNSDDSDLIRLLKQRIFSMQESVAYYNKENEKLNRVLYSPYFGKISLTEAKNYYHYYIGIKNVSKDKDIYVIDWRTPICSLYYDKKIGNTSYYSPDGEIFVSLNSKKQFKIENGKLLKIYDTSDAVCDTMLLDALSGKSNTYMKNIISTIGAEQDKIIRESSINSVIVNGVAGSGKTVIGMHRIAYLLYLERGKLTNKNVLIISPNSFFTKYISRVLPELGEDDVETKSMLNIFNEMDLTDKCQSRTKLVEDVINGNNTRLNEANFKYKQEFVDRINEFLSKYNSIELIKENLQIGNKLIYADELKNLYFKPNQCNIFKSIDVTTERILDRYFYSFSESGLKKIKQIIKTYFYKKVFTLNYRQLYLMFLKQMSFDSNILSESGLRYEDLPALVYSKFMLNGVVPNYTFKQIFIDEMQDYDALTIFLLRKIFPSACFTMVGDYNQNLLFDSDNKQAIETEFCNAKFYDLTTSYRSTENILKLACNIIGKKYEANFLRKGQDVEILQARNFEENIKNIKFVVKKLRDKNVGRIAILCKNDNELKKYNQYFLDFGIFDEEKENIDIGNSIMATVYDSKGLEFDAVIVPNVSKENFNNIVDRRLLYVLCTRALHELYLFSEGEISQFLK